MIQHNGPISGIAASANFVATAGYDNQVILWNAKTKKSIARGCHDHLANRCEISADERFVVSASSDYSVRLWEIPSMRLKAIFVGHEDDVEMARFSPDGQSIATCSHDGSVRVWSLTGVCLQVFNGHEGCVVSLTWSSDGRFVVSAGDDGTVRKWGLKEGKQIEVTKPEDVQTDSVAMNSMGVIFAGNDLGEIFRIENGSLQKIKAHRSGIKNLTLSRDGLSLVSISYDRSLCWIDVSQGMEIKKRIALHPLLWARSCAFLTSDNLIFGTFGSSYAKLNLESEEWDLSSVGSTSALNAVLAEEENVFCVGDSGKVGKSISSPAITQMEPQEQVSEMGSLCNFLLRYKGRLVTGGHTGQIFDAQTGEVLLSLKCPINKGIEAGGYLILATYVGELAICRFNDEGSLELLGEFPVLKNAVKDLAAQGLRVFCGGAAADIAVFDLEKMERVGYRESAHRLIVNSCVSLQEGRFATVSRDRDLKIWNGVECEEVIKTPFRHSVKTCSASSDGNFVAAGAYDGSFAIYDVSKKSWVRESRLSSTGLSSISFNSNSFWITSYEGMIHRESL